MVRIKLGPVSTAATCDIQSGKIAVNDMVKFLSADGTVILDNIPLRAIICTTGRPKELTKEIAPPCRPCFPQGATGYLYNRLSDCKRVKYR